ncbi:hypothetical protein JFL43_11835 [Viridibacillus sp. YIM B01967]|uniref:Uncharacterized protein n=1 Tax=Viridibacillus soli TaxID=2798301 RepID=A0ABS1H7Y5_9BACL|nr:hypothetical protein [Viridibacillus soli]MBK3495530.1 hypothetical protein [Viridibacillus soli]
MATKSRNSNAFLWSVLALFLAVISLTYCVSFILDLVNISFERTTRTFAQLTRWMGGA